MTKILKYRSDLQANECIRLLDFGCGKGHFANKLSSLSSLFKCYLYDVSTDYVPSWSEHVSSSRYACFNIPDSWLGAFDVITSLFSLEHVQDPIEELKKFKLLLSFQGFAYIVVPNMYSENRMDMLVADHIHHYSPLSMRKALQKAGLELVEEDHVSHSQSSIYIAKNCPERSRPVHNPNITDKYLQMQKDLAMSFQSSFDMLDSFLESKRGRPIAIVGAGVIGSLISSLIDNRMQIACFVDSSEFKQKKGWLSTRVISPLDLDKLSTVPPPVYIIAFNPKMAPIGLSMVPKSVQSSDVFSLFSPQ
jgi:SAM-dependent methyltransferase